MSEPTLFDRGSDVVPLSEMAELVERSKIPCSHCNEVAALNPHRICKQKVASLEMLARARGWCRCEQGRGFRIEESGEWLHGPYGLAAHATRLWWFGLAERKSPREGLFRVTELGVAFLCGKRRVPARILCRGGIVYWSSVETVAVGDVQGVKLDKAYWDAYPWAESYQVDEEGKG